MAFADRAFGCTKGCPGAGCLCVRDGHGGRWWCGCTAGCRFEVPTAHTTSNERVYVYTADADLTQRHSGQFSRPPFRRQRWWPTSPPAEQAVADQPSHRTQQRLLLLRHHRHRRRKHDCCKVNPRELFNDNAMVCCIAHVRKTISSYLHCKTSAIST
jgi:hypothetical protein